MDKNAYQSKRWKELRLKIIGANRFCKHCGTNINLQIDHIKEHKWDSKLFWDETNLQVLCIKCHGKKSKDHLESLGIVTRKWKSETTKRENFFKLINKLKNDNSYTLKILLGDQNGFELEKKFNLVKQLSYSYLLINYSIYLKIKNDNINEYIEDIKGAIVRIFLKLGFYTSNIEIKPIENEYESLLNFIKNITNKGKKQNV